MKMNSTPAPADVLPNDAAPANAAPVIREEPINILIVDDEPKNLTVLETVLDDPSYRLVRAESAEQALLALVVEEFALLILDIQMPGMTGFELAHMIKDRKKTARIPIIFLTAYYNEDQHVLEGYGTGAVDYLHKPVNAAILRSKVAVFAELHRKSRHCEQVNRNLLAEVTQRRMAEQQLRELNESLEQRVTERTEVLREREHFLQRMTDVSPSIIVVFDLEEERCVFINRTVASVLGYSAEEITAMGATVVPMLMHPDDLARFPAHHDRVRALRDDETADFEHRMRDRAGEWHWFHNRDAVFARDAAGAVCQLIGTANEITARKQAEAALRASEEFNRTVLESSPDCVKVLDGEGRLDFMNQNGQCLMEIDDFAVLRGQPWWLLWPEAERPKVRAAVEQALRGEVARFIAPAPTAKGNPRWWDVIVAPIAAPGGEGGVGSLISVSRDISAQKAAEAELHRRTTELRESEARARLATEATAVGIWEWNVLTHTIRWDAQMFRIHGLAPTPDGFVQYSDWSGAVLPEDLAETERILHDTMRRCGQSHREFRIRRHADGEVRDIEAAETVRTDAQGQAEWVLGTNLDVTERKRAEAALRDTDQRKDEFLAMLGHELRNPLAAIRHAVRIAEDTPEDHEACRWASEVVDRQSAQLARMVDDLLDISRINCGRIDLRPEALDLRPVLKHAIAVVRPFFEEKRHTFTAEIGDHLAVTGDAARLQQVFVNLLHNAVKYTPDGGAIALTAQHQDGELIVRITDTGVGITADLLPHVFDLFCQAETTLDRAQGGLGIGLSVVKSLVEMHLGSVAMESAGEGRGTTVTVRLPRLLDPSATPALRQSAPPSTSLPRAVRVLIVDDHHDSARALGRLLTRRGCEIKLAHDGPDGLAAARDFLPEICLLDIGLPGFDGYELARQIRADATHPRPILIAISGYAADADRAQSQAAGFDLHCAKPIDLETILDVVRSKCPV